MIRFLELLNKATSKESDGFILSLSSIVARAQTLEIFLHIA
jgi:hypothetical protein